MLSQTSETTTERRTGQTLSQLYRFILVGIINTVIGYGIFFIAQIYVNYLVALIVAHIVGVSVSYIWNRMWTFRSKNGKIMEFAKFESVYLIGLLVNIAALYIAADLMRFDPRIVQLLLLPLITVLTFFGHKCWSFRG